MENDIEKSITILFDPEAIGAKTEGEITRRDLEAARLMLDALIARLPKVVGPSTIREA